MAVLAQNPRSFIGRGRCSRNHRVDLGIHGADDVGCDVAALIVRAFPGMAYRALVVHEATWVVVPYPSGHGVVTGRVARLVAKRPCNDARMVLIAHHHTSAPLEHVCPICGVMREVILEGVRL